MANEAYSVEGKLTLKPDLGAVNNFVASLRDKLKPVSNIFEQFHKGTQAGLLGAGAAGGAGKGLAGAAGGAVGMAALAGAVAAGIGVVVDFLKDNSPMMKSIMNLLNIIVTIILLPLNAILRPVLMFLLLFIRLMMPNMKKATDALMLSMQALAKGDITGGVSAAVFGVLYLLKPFFDALVVLVGEAMKLIANLLLESMAVVFEQVPIIGGLIAEKLRAVKDSIGDFIDLGVGEVIAATNQLIDTGFFLLVNELQRTGSVSKDAADKIKLGLDPLPIVIEGSKGALDTLAQGASGVQGPVNLLTTSIVSFGIKVKDTWDTVMGILGQKIEEKRESEQQSWFQKMLDKLQNIIFPGSVKGDFIMRPGQAPVSFSPSDTIMGTKSPSEGGSTVNITINNPNVSSKSDIDTLVREISRNMQIELRRRSSYYGGL